MQGPDQMQISSVSKAYFAMLLTSSLWGFIGIFTRRLSAAGFGAMETSFIRMFISVAILLVLMFAFDRDGLRVRKKDLWLFLFIGIFRMLSDYFLFAAQVRIHLSLSTVLQLTAPYWVLLMSVILFREEVTRRKIVAIFMAFLGCVFATGVLEKGVTYDTIGVCFALLAGIGFAAYIVGNKVILDRGYSPLTALVYVLLFSTLCCVPFIDFGHMAGNIDSSSVVVDILVMSLVMTLFAYYFQTYATKYLSTVTVSIITLLEVFIATLVGLFYYHESLTVLSLLGLILIPLSIIIMNVDVRQKLQERRALK